MNPTNGPLLPMKIGKVNSTPFEEVSAVKIVEGFVLVMQTITVSREVFNNDQWRFKTYESFKKTALIVAEKYVGEEVCLEDIEINHPMENPSKHVEMHIEILFSAHIPMKIGRKEVN